MASQIPDGSPYAPTRGGGAFVVSIVVVTAIVLAAGGIGSALLFRGGHDAPTMRVAPGGALDLSTVADPLVEHYRFAAAHPHAYAQVPCFCGCEATLGHRSLLDCFVRPQGGWEAHAAGCAVCVQESQTVRSMLADGASPARIRAEIVARYTTA